MKNIKMKFNKKTGDISLKGVKKKDHAAVLEALDNAITTQLINIGLDKNAPVVTSEPEITTEEISMIPKVFMGSFTPEYYINAGTTFAKIAMHIYNITGIKKYKKLAIKTWAPLVRTAFIDNDANVILVVADYTRPEVYDIATLTEYKDQLERLFNNAGYGDSIKNIISDTDELINVYSALLDGAKAASYVAAFINKGNLKSMRKIYNFASEMLDQVQGGTKPVGGIEIVQYDATNPDLDVIRHHQDILNTLVLTFNPKLWDKHMKPINSRLNKVQRKMRNAVLHTHVTEPVDSGAQSEVPAHA